jgi:two-component sensor histidine kinase
VTGPTLREQNDTLQKLLDQAGIDSAQRDVAERIQAVLTGELHHRMRNMLTMVTAIVRQSLRSASSLASAESAITARLMAMAKAHELLLNADLKTASLKDIVQGATEQHNIAAGRFQFQGDEFEVLAASILPLMLMLNELCTNAAKYGALSTEGGVVSLKWNLDDGEKFLTFKWIESGGPAVRVPGPKSFGTRLIEEALPRQMGGQGLLTFPETGVEFECSIPVENLTAKP